MRRHPVCRRFLRELSAMRKGQEILQPRSDWNNAANDEPIFIIRANNWKAAMMVAMVCKNNTAEETGFLDAVMEMREYDLDKKRVVTAKTISGDLPTDEDIPF